MPTETNRLSREAITDAAFRAWGRTHFCNTSLNLVAQELEVTKPAVYRYFKGKDALLEALRLDYARRLEEDLVGPLTEGESTLAPEGGRLDGVALERAARAYVTAVYSFFEQNPYHYAFFLRYLLGRPFELQREFRDTIERHDQLLLRHLSSPVAMRYVSGTAAYWTTEHYRRDPRTGQPRVGLQFEPVFLREPGRSATIDTIIRRLLWGFLPSDPHPVDLELVERIAWLAPEEMPPADRVLSAIEEIVHEQGYGAATVERIAERIGITKSSLYHYFRNRDEMLAQVILRDQQHFASLARIRMQQIEHPEQQLYAFFVMIASYGVQHPALLTVENWIRENDIPVELPEEHIHTIQEIFSFLTEMVMTGKLAADPLEAFAVIGFVRFLILQELNLMQPPITREHCIQATRTLFALFSRGIGSFTALKQAPIATEGISK
jgi:AcrR family transcriptional regulator